jgi:hypothetical protein
MEEQSLEMTETSKLVASNGAAGDHFGFTAAITGDIAVVGAPSADTGGNQNRGAAYVYARANGNWSEKAILVANDGGPGDNFGYSVAIDGDTIAVGSPNAGAKGAIYIFVRSGDDWVQQQKLLANDGAEGDRFGNSIAIEGDTLIGGASDNAASGQRRGAVYVFARGDGDFTEQAKLVANDGNDLDFFGNSVAIQGDTVVVGAPDSSESQPGTNPGSAYVFVHANGAWALETKLTANDPADDDFFGESVSLNGNTVAISASGVDVDGQSNCGAIYVFQRDGAVWTQQAKLLADDAAAGDFFGLPVSLVGDTLITTAALKTIPGKEFRGAGYVFTRSGAVWEQHLKLTASDEVKGELLGLATAFDGQTALVGCRYGIISGQQQQGSVYVFELQSAPDLPQIAAAEVDHKRLIVEGSNFQPGAELYLDGQKQKKTRNDDLSPSTRLIARKSGKRIAPGQTVSLIVRNPDGKSSLEFKLTRPAQ